MIVVRLVTPNQQLLGYLKRFMLEVDAGLLVGSGNRELIDEVAGSLSRQKPKGLMIVSDVRSESGFCFRYFCIDGKEIIDFDGVEMIEKPFKTAS